MDPRTTNIIYAGTWYLPYKSTDGGQSWKSIKNGSLMIQTFLLSILIHEIRITLSPLLAVESMKPAMREMPGRRYREFLLNREGREP